jgi:hypothetical protein
LPVTAAYILAYTSYTPGAGSVATHLKHTQHLPQDMPGHRMASLCQCWPHAALLEADTNHISKSCCMG